MKKILLASASPRRRELLDQCGISFELLVIDNDSVESVTSPSGPDFGAWVEQAAIAKLSNAEAEAAGHDAILLCADTIVVSGGRAMGKPVDAEDAARMLHALSGCSHEVFTGVALLDTATGRKCSFHERTEVVFRKMTGGQIEAYIRSGEPFDKAGAYGIQGLAGAFIEKVDGCCWNVVGLPVSRLAEVLATDLGFDITSKW